MADNSVLPVDGGTETFANDDVGGVKYPRAKLSLGADGAAVDAVGGAGAVSSAVQRTTLASDDPAVAALGLTAAGIRKAEDAAHSSGDTGVMVLAVRKDTSSTGIGADGDYVPLAVDASGRVYVTAPLLEALISSGALLVKLDPTTVNANGRAPEADSAPVAMADEEFALLTGIDADTDAIKTAVQIIDDWDESDRAKVNLIVGQAGVAAGTGSAGATVVRTVTASDSPEVTKLGGGLSNRVFAVDFATLTRPANTTPYSAADSISDNATAGSVTALVSGNISDVNDDPIFISEIHVRSTDTGLAGKKLRAYLFNSNPTSSSGVGGGDNAAYSQKIAGYIGSFVGVMETGFSDGTVGRLVPAFNDANVTPAGAFIPALPVSGARTLYIQYQAVEAFTPSANSTTIIGKAKGWQGRAV